MSSCVAVDRVLPDDWRASAATFVDNNIYQAWQFGTRRAAEMKGQVSRLVLYRDNIVVGMAQVRIKTIPLLGSGIAHIYRGPLWRRSGSSESDLQATLDSIRREYVVRRGLTVRMVPNLPEFLADENVLAVFDSAGFAHDSSTQPYRTFILDLSPPLAEIRRQFAQKWRNCLNQSEKRGLTVEAGTDDVTMGRVETLYKEMVTRKKFLTHVSWGLFRRLQAGLHPTEKLVVLLASWNGQPVAGHVSSFRGDTCIYVLGVSSELGRRHRASYLLQWEAMVRAKGAGARWYDLGGIDPVMNPGVYHFKAGVGGRECRFAGRFHAWPSLASRCFVAVGERAYQVLTAMAHLSKPRKASA